METERFVTGFKRRFVSRVGEVFPSRNFNVNRNYSLRSCLEHGESLVPLRGLLSYGGGTGKTL